jgi:hypothetical protein
MMRPSLEFNTELLGFEKGDTGSRGDPNIRSKVFLGRRPSRGFVVRASV